MRNKIKKIVALATSAMVVGIAAPSVVKAWGDSGEGGLRRGYTLEQIQSGILGSKIVFNSITNSEPIGGDERNFVAARENTANPSAATNKWNANDITVENGKEYVIRAYVHNNSPLGKDAVALNTKVAFSIPSTSAKQVQVNGFISASNANPDEYWDYVNFNADQAFHLEYVYGSALLENNGIGLGGKKLSDEIVTKATKGGTLIGYDALDGKIPGCYQYASYVTIRVKAVFDTDYKIDKEVRLIGGEKKWSNYVNAEIGDIVEFRVSYQNLHKTETQDNVVIKDILPKNLRYVPGTTKLVNVKYPNGTILSPDGSIIGDGVSIGGYTAGSNAYIYLRAEVVDDGLACGNNTLTNWAQGSVGVVTIQDYANVVVNKTCPNKVNEKTYDLAVHYVYENGKTAFKDKKVTGFKSGDPYNVASPTLNGYTVDKASVSGKFKNANIEETVVYKKIEAPKPATYSLTIHYVYENGKQAAKDHYEAKLIDGTSYGVESPKIDGYYADQENVTGKISKSNVELTVTYKKTPVKPGVDDTPDQPDQPDEPEKLPDTGVTEIVSTVLALGSTVTASGYYVASRRALKK